ncbi:MAG: hypothetical protein ABR543_05040 [Gemmatimonadaceae bacterium]
MPKVSFSALPSSARVWVFGSQDPLTVASARILLNEVDSFLDGWHAHGTALTSAREWRDDRFLAVAVDQNSAAASGCSIDGLFRIFQRLEPQLGTSLLGGGRVYFRKAGGEVEAVTREEFADRALAGEVSGSTPVFDTSVTTLADYRERFEAETARSWHSALLPDSVEG